MPTVEPDELPGLPAFGFADPGPLRDQLTEAVVAGLKTATTSLLAEYEVERQRLPQVGERWVVYDSDVRPVAIIETTAWRVATIGTVDDEFARAEGEGFPDSAAWKTAHIDFWSGFLAELREQLGDPDFSLTADTPVVCERFRLLERIDDAAVS